MKVKTHEGSNAVEGCAFELFEEVDEVGSYVEDPLAVPIDVIEMLKVLTCSRMLVNTKTCYVR